MEIVIVHGQSHHGSTYNIANILAHKVGGNITEFLLPKDFNDFCIGCTKCFIESEMKCPHYDRLKPLTDALDKAGLIIIASPVYVMHATGSMKAFLDHLGYSWMAHRPKREMFRKQAVCVSTAAGLGMKSTNKDMADSLFFLGIPKIYKYSKALGGISWNNISDENKESIDKSLTILANKINEKHGKVKPGLKTKAAFLGMRFFQKKGLNKVDFEYWKKNGWLDKERPWK